MIIPYRGRQRYRLSDIGITHRCEQNLTFAVKAEKSAWSNDESILEADEVGRKGSLLPDQV